MTNAVSLTTDVWTSTTTEGFITVTTHLISPTWELNSVSMETVRITDAHTPVNIAEALTKIWNNWNILNKVCSVVTDSAASMTSAVDTIIIMSATMFRAHSAFSHKRYY